MHSKIIPAVLVAAVLAVPAVAQKTTRHVARAAAAASFTPAGAWRSVYSDAKVRVALDTPQTRHESDGTYRVRLRWQYPTSQTIGRNRSYRTLVDRTLIDCGTLGIKPIAARTYDAKGKPVSGYDTQDSQLSQIDWAKRPAGSSAARAYAAVCAAIRR